MASFSFTKTMRGSHITGVAPPPVKARPRVDSVRTNAKNSSVVVLREKRRFNVCSKHREKTIVIINRINDTKTNAAKKKQKTKANAWVGVQKQNKTKHLIGCTPFVSRS